MHFMIVGSGAVGGYFGAKLAQQGEQVTFVARNEHLSAMKEHGLRVNSINGNFCLNPVKAQRDSTGVKNVDVVIIAVKTFQLKQAVELIKPVLSDTTRILPLLNGVDATEQLIEAGVPPFHIYGGLAKIISKVSEPGVITHMGAEPHITMGILTHPADTTEVERFERIARRIKESNISLRTTQNINTALWRKYIFVAAWGTLAATKNTTIGELRLLPARSQLVQIINEYIDIAHAHGVEITPNVAQETMKFIDALPEASKTSMQRDIEHVKASEFGSLVFYAYQLAKAYSINTPVLANCYHILCDKVVN